MNMSAPVERSKKEPKDNVASAGEPTTAANLSPNKPSVGKPAADKQVTDKQVTDKTLAGAPAKPLDAPMHAAKGDDDIMSQPQASQRGKKKS